MGLTIGAIGTLIAAPGAAVASGLGGGLLAEALGAGITGALVGGGTSLLTGSNPLKGAEFGFLTGGLGELGGALGGAAFGGGLGATIGEGLGGALGGYAATGKATGALEGGLGALVQGAIGSPGTTAGPGATTTGGLAGAGGGTSAAAVAGPSSVAADMPETVVVTGSVPSQFNPITAGASNLGFQLAGGNNDHAGSGPSQGMMGQNAQNLQAGIGSGNVGLPGGGTGTDLAQALGLSGGKGGAGSGFIKDNLGKLAMGGLSLYEKGQQDKKLGAMLAPLNNQAAAWNRQGQSLSAAMFGGQLPPGAKAMIDQASQTQRAQIRSQYASMGLSGSTMEQDALSGVDRQVAQQSFGMANQLMDEGFKLSDASQALYSNIINTQMTQDANLSGALANLVGELNFGG